MNDELVNLAKRAAKGIISRRDFLGRATALGVTAVSANAMLAGAAQAAGPVKGGVLKVGLQGGESTNTLDPALSASTVPFQNLRCFGECLLNVSPDGKPDFRVAESVEASSDAKTWTFKIRKGIEFHNGKTVTADDVHKTMARHSNDEATSGALGIMKGIESMKSDGEYFSVSLSTPNADLPYLLADYHLVIQPGGGMENPADGIGSGAYKVDEDEPGVRHKFVKFANYWDDSLGHLDAVENIVLNDATARTAALQSGQVHMIDRVEPKIAQLLDRAPNVEVKSVSGPGHYVFIMHADTAPFDANDLRMALKLAIDREQMVDKILRGYGSVGNDFPINKAYPLFDATIAQRKYDPSKAAEYYAKSGHDGSPIILRVADGAFPGAVDAAALFQESARAAGIPLEIKREPNDGYWTEVWNKQPFCASYWGGRPVQDQMYSTAYLSTADWNDTRFKRPDFDALLLSARGELDTDRRKQTYSKMAHLVRDEGGLILPMFNDFIEGVSKNVGGWVDDPNFGMMNGLVGQKTWLIS